jgi:hypothetical protein
VEIVLDQLERVLLDITHEPSRLSPEELEKFRDRLKTEGILFKIRVLGSNVRREEEIGQSGFAAQSDQLPGAEVDHRKGGRLVHQSPSNHGQILFEIYESSSDVNVKRAALNAFSASGDTDRLLQIAKTEKDAELRRDAVRRLTSLKNPAATDALVAMYGSEQDKEVKRAIINSLASQNDVKQLVAVARTEKDPETVRYIVSRLAGMKSPEASDYLMEILKK